MPGMEPKTVIQAAVGVGLAATFFGALFFLLLKRKKR
jgi:LPXTG-motif cell wall-anchored protein